MAHTSPAAFVARIVEGTTRTTTGTQNITYSGIGGVKGMMILAARLVTEDTVEQGYSVCMGFVDNSGRERVVSTWGQDAVADTNCGTQGTRNSCLRLLNPSTGAVLVEASYSQNVTDGIQLNYTIVEVSAWKYIAVLFAGQDTSCFVGDEVPNAVSGAAKTVTTGIAQDFVICATTPTIGESIQHDHAVFITGIATRDDEDNFLTGFAAHDGEAVGRSARLARNDTCGYKVLISGATISAVVGTAITNHTSTGFDVSSVGTSGNTGDRIAFLAVQAGTTSARVEATGSASATTTGVTTYGFPAHRTGFLIATSSMCTSQNSIVSQGAAAIGVWDGRTEASIGIMDENTADPTNLGMIYRNRIFEQYSHAQVEFMEAAMEPMHGTGVAGFSVDYTTAPATARRLVFLSVLEYPFLIHNEETVEIADAHVKTKSAIQANETVQIDEGKVVLVSTIQNTETVQIDDSVKLSGSIIVVGNETVNIADSAIMYTGQVLTASETVEIADSFVSAGTVPMKASGWAEIVSGGAEAGHIATGGAKVGEVLH